MIKFLLGAAIGAAIVLFNFCFLLYKWSKEDMQSDNINNGINED
jgi:hypothetical protein